MAIPFHKIPLNLPHASTVSQRIVYFFERMTPVPQAALERAEALAEFLDPFQLSGENPPEDEAKTAVARAAELTRVLVDEIERSRIGSDRLGQMVRNVYECLELGRESFVESLRAGENPDSPLRPI